MSQPPPRPHSANVTLGLTRKSLEGVVIHACPHCGAPGLFKTDFQTRVNWPGCWTARLEDFNRPVGDICPNCKKRRRRDKNLGELTASMPRWLWQCILGFKWCLIQVRSFRKGA